jgi:hypothetical protein
MMKWIARLAWMGAGVAGLYALSALASVASGGSLDPPGTPASTMKTLAALPPSWFQQLLSTDGAGDGCNSTRFTCVLNNQAVLDNETGLVWTRSTSGSNPTFYGATQECHEYMTIAGRKGWRLPAASELASLIDTTQAPFRLPAGHPFNDIGQFGIGPYWTSTVDQSNSTAVLMVNFETGSVLFNWPKAGTPAEIIEHFWCVRGPGETY